MYCIFNKKKYWNCFIKVINGTKTIKRNFYNYIDWNLMIGDIDSMILDIKYDYLRIFKISKNHVWVFMFYSNV